MSITTLEQVFIRLAAEAKTKASKGFLMGEHNSKFEDDDDYNDEAGIFGAVGAMLRGLVDPQ